MVRHEKQGRERKKKSISAKPGKIMPHLPSKEMDPALTKSNFCCDNV